MTYVSRIELLFIFVGDRIGFLYRSSLFKTPLYSILYKTKYRTKESPILLILHRSSQDKHIYYE